LQATTLCLRQVIGNTHKARIYPSMDNRAIFDCQLQETYGETIANLDHAGRETATATLRLRKLDLPPLVVTQIVRTVTRAEINPASKLRLKKPKTGEASALARATFTIAEQQATYRVLQQVGETVTIAAAVDTLDTYTAAVRLATLYWLNVALSDVPEKKDDLVSGVYELAGPDKETTVAVKIIDMLGEEVLVTKRV
jgi:hypothetical protein